MGYKYDKEDILNTGYDVLRKNGYHNVGINQVLKEAGIPKGSFYNFFESKADFANQVVSHYAKDNHKWMQQYFLDTELSPLEALKSFYKIMIDFNEKDDFASGCLLNVLGNEIGRQNDELAENVNQYFIGWLNILDKVIFEGQKEGEITTRFTSLELAEYLHSGFYGTFSRMKVTRNRVYMDTWFDMSFEFIKNNTHQNNEAL